MEFVVGTSGYSFKDWSGTFYPAGTQAKNMLTCYAQHFESVEINFSYYRMPSWKTLEGMVKKTPDTFEFWIKVFGGITHEHDISYARDFIASLGPVIDSGKLAGVLFQFPQSFHRTSENREFLKRATDAFDGVNSAVEFRHSSWQTPATFAGLRERNLTLVVPDVPNISSLYQCPPQATTRTAYVRLHSRNKEKWYGGPVDRYDYDYSEEELGKLLTAWSALEEHVDRSYTFFNNCHRGQAAQNAETFRRLLEQIE